MKSERKWSPVEEKVLAFSKFRHAGQIRLGGEDYFNHPKRIAEYLYDRGYRGKYVFTAFCHDLMEDTNTTEEELLDLCGRFTRDAVKLLTKPEGADIAAYLEKIRTNEVAYIVKVADRIDNLRDAQNAGFHFQKKILKETEEFYLDFAADSPFFNELQIAYDSLKEHHDSEKEKRIVVVVDNAYKAVNGNEDLNILDSFFFGSGSEESFPLACILEQDEIEFAALQKDKELVLTLSAFPTSELKIYKNEEEYLRINQDEVSFAIRSFFPSWQVMQHDGNEIPDPSACFTGIVKETYEPFKSEDDEFFYHAVDVDTLGFIITLILREDRNPIPETGNIVTGVYRLNGYVDIGDQELKPSKSSNNERMKEDKKE